MYGKLILATETQWRRTALAILITAVPTLAAAWAGTLWLRRFLHLEGVLLQGGSAVLALVIAWLVYGFVRQRLPRREQAGTLLWTVTDDDLTLGDDTIPRSAIRAVHCWKKPEGWLVNIELRHASNRLLRAENSDAGAASLRALVEALGFERSWREQ